MNQPKPLLPGASVGVIGGGQLGRYFVLAARRLGYVTWVLDPDVNAPAMQVCEHALEGAYNDETKLVAMAKACDAITIEFENVPAQSLQVVSKHARIAPRSDAVTIAQDRHAEKQTAIAHGLQPVPYAVIDSSADFDAAIEQVQFPAILKTARLGYDGKGQHVCHSRSDLETAFASVSGVSCVLEQRIELSSELSVVLARGFDGTTACFPVAENVHTNGILDVSSVPSEAKLSLQDKAKSMATSFADGLDYVGVLAIEFFVTTRGDLLFNEMAPRPHNSGHYTLDATATSQFEQQLRTLCALPLGSTDLLSPVCMLNVLGDSWPQTGIPEWMTVFDEPAAHLHLYGKSAARPGRKMGHINCLGDDAGAVAAKLRDALSN